MKVLFNDTLISFGPGRPLSGWSILIDPPLDFHIFRRRDCRVTDHQEYDFSYCSAHKQLALAIL
jgi:hypothetical protein